jgi:outer membrane protein OmpA-like peptidoglycan-associated protein
MDTTMREVMGIIIGILGFLLLTVYTVKRHGTFSLPQEKTARLPMTSPSVRPHETSSKALTDLPVESPPSQGPVAPPTPHGATTARPSALPKASFETPASLPLPRPSSPPDQVIYFPSGYTGLSLNNRNTLNRLLPTLRKAPAAQIEIHGHTDDTGHSQFNHDLSRLRADIVHYYLQAQGIEESRFTTKGHGSSAPVSDNRLAIGRQRNRRTEIFIH